MDIAPSTFATLCQQLFLAVFNQIGDDGTCVAVSNDRSDRHMENNVIRSLAVTIGTTTVFTVFGAVHLGIVIIDQGIHVIVGNDPYTPAFPAIAAVRAAKWFEFFAVERSDAIASVTGDYLDSCFVNKFHRVVRSI